MDSTFSAQPLASEILDEVKLTIGEHTLNLNLIELKAQDSDRLFGDDHLEALLGYSLEGEAVIQGPKPPLKGLEKLEKDEVLLLNKLMNGKKKGYGLSNKEGQEDSSSWAETFSRHLGNRIDNAKKKPNIVPHRPDGRFPSHLLRDSKTPTTAVRELGTKFDVNEARSSLFPHENRVEKKARALLSRLIDAGFNDDAILEIFLASEQSGTQIRCEKKAEIYTPR